MCTGPIVSLAVESLTAARLRCLKTNYDKLGESCKKAHPCLHEEHPHACRVLEYGGKPPTFIKDISRFLNDIRSGVFFNPVRRMLHLGVPPPPRRIPFFAQRALEQDADDYESDQDEEDSNIKLAKVVRKEQKHVEEEIRELHRERAKLDAERSKFMDTAIKAAKKAGKDADEASGGETDKSDASASAGSADKLAKTANKATGSTKSLPGLESNSASSMFTGARLAIGLAVSFACLVAALM